MGSASVSEVSASSSAASAASASEEEEGDGADALGDGGLGESSAWGGLGDEYDREHGLWGSADGAWDVDSDFECDVGTVGLVAPPSLSPPAPPPAADTAPPTPPTPTAAGGGEAAAASSTDPLASVRVALVRRGHRQCAYAAVMWVAALVLVFGSIPVGRSFGVFFATNVVALVLLTLVLVAAFLPPHTGHPLASRGPAWCLVKLRCLQAAAVATALLLVAGCVLFVVHFWWIVPAVRENCDVVGMCEGGSFGVLLALAFVTNAVGLVLYFVFFFEVVHVLAKFTDTFVMVAAPSLRSERLTRFVHFIGHAVPGWSRTARAVTRVIRRAFRQVTRRTSRRFEHVCCHGEAPIYWLVIAVVFSFFALLVLCLIFQNFWCTIFEILLIILSCFG